MAFFQDLQEWLDGLKPGDTVLIKGSYTSQIDTIERITPSRQFILKNHGERFNREGNSIGSHRLYRSWLSKFTEEERKRLEHEELASKVWGLIHDLNINKIKLLPDARLQELLEVLTKQEPESKTS